MVHQKSHLLIFIALFISVSSFGQVVINEYSAANLHSFQDGFGKTEDWIELYNTSSETIDLSGYHLSDKEHKPAKWEIPSGTLIGPNEFLVFSCSGRDGVFFDHYHTNFKLAQTKPGDGVLLSDPQENIINYFPLELTMVEHSRCRATDGSAEWTICTNPSYGTSNNNTNQIVGYTAAPTIELEAGFYNGGQTVSITNNEPNSILRYTTDGTNPKANDMVYTTPITFSETTVMKAQAFSNNPNILPGKMDFSTYFIDVAYSLPVFSVAADQLINLANGQGELIPIGSLEYFNEAQEREATSFGDLNRHGQDSWVLDHRSLDWISRDEMGYSKAVNAPIFNYSDRDQYQKFMFRNSGDDNYPAINDQEHEGSTHIRDEYVQELALVGGMKLDVRANERVILYLNGEYWGVYGMRERPVDHDYTKEYYDQGKYQTQFLSTWETTEIEYGGAKALDDWEKLRNFILDNDMSNPENYQIAEDSINMTSLIDYMTMNLNVVASDWLNYNTGWWRGRNPEGDHKKWGYILWDLDATFDYYINYTGVPNISSEALPCDINQISQSMDIFFGTQTTAYGEILLNNNGQLINYDTTIVCPTILSGASPYPITDSVFQQVIAQDAFCCQNGWDDTCQLLYNDIETNFSANTPQTEGFSGNVGRHEKIFLKLLEESPEFKQLYYTRYADLMNTVFTCENMNTRLDSMLAIIEPEMPKQISRWGGSMAEWEENVEDLKAFINRRCEFLDDAAMDCFNELTDVHELTLMATPEGVGEIDLNTLDIEQFPWTGTYFEGVENIIKANIFNEYEDDYEFSHWISSNNNVITPSVNEIDARLSLTGSDTLTAVFVLKETTSVTDVVSELDKFDVYPNPTQSELNLSYSVNESVDVSVSFYNINGQLVHVFDQISKSNAPGTYQEVLSIPDNIPSGFYFLSLRINDKQVQHKVSVIK